MTLSMFPKLDSQVYADWWYAWCFTYFMSPHDVHRYVYITLKKSLRWVPIVGWVRQSSVCSGVNL